MATYTWLASGSGDFNVASNWTLDGVNPASTAPGPNDTVIFNTTTGTISGNPDVFKIFCNTDASNLTFTGHTTLVVADIQGTLTLASGASIDSGVLDVAFDPGLSGTFVVGPGASYLGTATAQVFAEAGSYLFNIGSNPFGTSEVGATGTAIVEGPGALVDLVDTRANEVPTGASVGILPGSTGSLQILAGGVAKFATTDPADYASLSVGRRGTGTVTVDGTGSQLQLSGYLAAARTGTGTVTLTNGATLTETAVSGDLPSFFGRGLVSGGVLLPAGTGFLNVLSGSTATFSDSLSFGLDGDTGVGLVSDGTLNVGGQLELGASIVAPGGKGTLTIEDGGVVRDTTAADPSTAYVELGAASGTTGTAVVDGWGSRLDAGANAIDVGTAGTGTLTALDHGLITSTGLKVGDQGDGTLNLTSGGAAIAKSPSDNGAALSVGAQAGGTGSINISGHGSALIAVGEAVLGGTDTGTGAVAGGTGDVSVSQGGLLGTGSMVIESGSSLGIDGTSAALIAGKLSDGGAITTSGLLAVTGTVSGAGSLTLDGGLTDAGGLAGANVRFGSPGAVLRVHALSGTSTVSGMQTGDVIDLAGMKGVTLTGDTVTANGGMLFLSPAPVGEAYRLITSQHGTEVLLFPTSAHGMNDAAMADMGRSFGGMDDLPNASADLIPNLGFTPAAAMMPVTAAGEAAGYMGAAAGTNVTLTAIDLATAHQLFAH
jgi:autotransporter family porin